MCLWFFLIRFDHLVWPTGTILCPVKQRNGDIPFEQKIWMQINTAVAGNCSNRKRDKEYWYASFLHLSTKSLARNVCGMVCNNGMGFTGTYPTPSANSEDVICTHDWFVTEINILEKLSMDLVAAFVGTQILSGKLEARTESSIPRLREQKNWNYATELEIGYLRLQYRQSSGTRHSPNWL